MYGSNIELSLEKICFVILNLFEIPLSVLRRKVSFEKCARSRTTHDAITSKGLAAVPGSPHTDFTDWGEMFWVLHFSSAQINNNIVGVGFFGVC